MSLYEMVLLALAVIGGLIAWALCREAAHADREFEEIDRWLNEGQG